MAGLDIDPLLAQKAARGITGEKQADPFPIFMRSIQAGIIPVYISNGMVQGTFGVHPHGWWRGGDVSYNPKTDSTLSQTLINQTGNTSLTADTDSAALYTVTAGKTLYLRTAVVGHSGAGNSLIQLKDGAGTTKAYLRENGAAPAGTAIYFDPPLSFTTSFILQDNATETVSWVFTGWEE